MNLTPTRRAFLESLPLRLPLTSLDKTLYAACCVAGWCTTAHDEYHNRPIQEIVLTETGAAELTKPVPKCECGGDCHRCLHKCECATCGHMRK